MDEQLLAIYYASTYRVRLSQGGTASLRIGQPLPASLLDLVGAAPWNFVTAWNPRSLARPRASNRQAQRQLMSELRQRDDVLVIRAGVGEGQTGWREASLFVVGPDRATMDGLAEAYAQNAYLHGIGQDDMRLRALA